MALNSMEKLAKMIERTPKQIKKSLTFYGGSKEWGDKAFHEISKRVILWQRQMESVLLNDTKTALWCQE